MRVFDRIKESSTSTGTGDMSLAGASSGFEAFGDRLDDGEQTLYGIWAGTEWEIGIGKYVVSGNKLVRLEVIYSSNNDALVNFSAGSKSVWVNRPVMMELGLIGINLALTRGLGVI